MTMATSSFVIKCKTSGGQFTISELNRHSTVKTLKEVIKKVTGIPLEKMKILTGFPPKAVLFENEKDELEDTGIETGETLIITVDDNMDNQVVPDLRESASSDSDKPTSSPKKRKRETPMLKQMKEFNSDPHSGIMMRYDVPSNNSCLFSSINFLVNDGNLNLSRSDELRRIIADAVSRDPVKYNAAILGRDNLEYCQWILNPANWGGAIELAILSEHFKLEIVAIDIMSCQMIRFGENNDYKRRGIVVYDGIHYDPLYMQLEDRQQTIFHVCDTQVLDSALEIAQEARSSKQYTDVLNFKLKCNDCGQHLIGEKDASAHASATGHVNFGELL